MQELLRNAVSGWQRYTDDGKYAVLLLGILLFYWYQTRSGSKTRTQNRELLWKYTVLTAGLAICPLTAVVLMNETELAFYLSAVLPIFSFSLWFVVLVIRDDKIQ